MEAWLGRQLLLSFSWLLPRENQGPVLPELQIFKGKLKILTFMQDVLTFDWFCFSKTNQTHLRLGLLAVLSHVWSVLR